MSSSRARICPLPKKKKSIRLLGYLKETSIPTRIIVDNCCLLSSSREDTENAGTQKDSWHRRSMEIRGKGGAGSRGRSARNRTQRSLLGVLGFQMENELFEGLTPQLWICCGNNCVCSAPGCCLTSIRRDPELQSNPGTANSLLCHTRPRRTSGSPRHTLKTNYQKPKIVSTSPEILKSQKS